MKIKKAILCAALTLLSQASFADGSPNAISSSSPTTANADSNFAKTTVGVAQDTAITTYIYAKMATHPDLANSNIDISTQEGKVILNGIVNSPSQAKEITQLAESTSGVKGVDATKLIIGQPGNSLYINKTAATSSVPQIDESTNKIEHEPTPSVAQTQPLAADPLLADAEQKPDIETAAPPAPKMQSPKKPVKAPKLSSNHHQLKKLKSTHHLAHHKSPVKKKALASKSTKHLHAHHPKTRTAYHHLKKHISKALAQLHKKHPHKAVLSQKNASKSNLATRTKITHPITPSEGKESKESVDQMTNEYLKSALTANKPIPEE